MHGLLSFSEILFFSFVGFLEETWLSFVRLLAAQNDLVQQRRMSTVALVQRTVPLVLLYLCIKDIFARVTQCAPSQPSYTCNS